MNKIKLFGLFLLVFNCFMSEILAQDGYTYTLQHNGGYDFTVQAVPNTSTNNFATSVQSYGFTIILPDGVTATITSSLGNGANTTFFDGTNVAQPTIDGYLITETLSTPISLTAPSAATNSDIVSFTINGNPTSGTLEVLANDSALATTVTPLKSFMQADMINNGMAEFVNVVDPNAAAVSGMNIFNFATLSTNEVTLTNVNVFPNPVKDTATISGITDLEAVEIINFSGQRVVNNTSSSNLKTIDMSQLPSGIYFVKINAISGSKTVKLIKE